jgi:hypothetical protein
MGVKRPSSSSNISQTQSRHFPQLVAAPVAQAMSEVVLAPSATAMRMVFSLMPWQMQTIIVVIEALWISVDYTQCITNTNDSHF